MLCAKHGPEADSTPSPKGVDKWGFRPAIRQAGGGGGGGGVLSASGPIRKAGGGGGGGGVLSALGPIRKAGVGWGVCVCCTLQAQYERRGVA